MLFEIQAISKLRSVTQLFFFALEQYLEQRKDIERQARIIEYKQKKIDALNERLNAGI